MSEAARVASRAHKRLSNSHCLFSVNSEQFKPIWTQVRKSNNFWSRRSVNLKPPQRSRKRDDGYFNPDRAQDSDSNTSQDQEGNTAEKDCAEKPESASAQEAPVHIDSQKTVQSKRSDLSDHFGTTKAAEKSVWILSVAPRSRSSVLLPVPLQRDIPAKRHNRPRTRFDPSGKLKRALSMAHLNVPASISTWISDPLGKIKRTSEPWPFQTLYTHPIRTPFCC